MIKWFKECSDFYRYFKKTPIEEKAITFYAEHSNYYPYFEGLIQELGKEQLCYVTSDYNDPVLGKAGTFYINKLLSWFMAFINCKVLVMTMTDLNLFHIRRSYHPVHYVYVFHSPVSTHMIYRFGAFDHYDSLLCVGQHQIEEIRKQEQLYELKPKRLIETGYYRLEALHKAHQNYNKEDREITILVAPTWGRTNLLEICGEKLLETLLTEDYKVILRLHPETVKRHQFANYDNITLETSVVSMDSLVKADILITDWSGIGLKYAFGTERPVIFIDTPPKVRNPRYKELDIEPIEASLREQIGIVVSPDNLECIPEVISNLLEERETYRKDIVRLREQYVFNFGKSSKVGADYIKELL